MVNERGPKTSLKPQDFHQRHTGAVHPRMDMKLWMTLTSGNMTTTTGYKSAG